MSVLIDHPTFLNASRAGPARARSSLEGSEARSVPPPLLLTERRLRGCAVMSVRGEVDISTVSQLDRAAAGLLVEAGGHLILDLSETAFMDLSGVRMAERLSRLAAAAGGGLAVVATTWGVRRVLALAAHPWLLVTADLETAMEAICDRGRSTR